MTSGVLRVSLEPGRGQSLAATSDSTHSIPLDIAVNALRTHTPEMSASDGLATWQLVAIYAVAVVTPSAVALVVMGRAGWIAALLTLPFAVIVLVRCAALWHLILPNAPAESVSGQDVEHELPRYTVLVPVYRESAIAPALVEAMAALAYPVDKLEVFFITEANDPQTRAALTAAHPPSHMHILTVPAGLPQTKPRALNFALQFATGELVGVFDAEDVPEPNQLRKAAGRFAGAGHELACVQARLSIYNPDDSFLTRQFTLEYAALFEAILPALERLGLPILLGGTSNHFRRSALIGVGAWDPFNVTEDADLGVRLARSGYAVAMLDSDTWEEAPRTARTWFGQRTRWLKGWMQTYLVHMRDPRRLMNELGAWQFAGVQVMLGGMVMSALVHPWIFFGAIACIVAGDPLLPASGTLWVICWFNFAAGHAVGVVLGLVSAWRSQGRVPLGSALDVPIYWLAISIACYHALWDLYRRPYHWEKTPHAARSLTSAPPQ